MNAAARRQTLAAAARKWRDAQPADATPNDEADIELEAVLLGLDQMAPDAVIEHIDYNADGLIVVFEDYVSLEIDWDGNTLRGA